MHQTYVSNRKLPLVTKDFLDFIHIAIKPLKPKTKTRTKFTFCTILELTKYSLISLAPPAERGEQKNKKQKKKAG